MMPAGVECGPDNTLGVHLLQVERVAADVIPFL
jgi:hypothetical protein